MSRNGEPLCDRSRITSVPCCAVTFTFRLHALQVSSHELSVANKSALKLNCPPPFRPSRSVPSSPRLPSGSAQVGECQGNVVVATVAAVGDGHELWSPATFSTGRFQSRAPRRVSPTAPLTVARTAGSSAQGCVQHGPSHPQSTLGEGGRGVLPFGAQGQCPGGATASTGAQFEYAEDAVDGRGV